MSSTPEMKEKSLAVLDFVSLGLLLLLPILAILHFLFRPTFTIFAIDIAAWVAFGGPLFLSGLLRWLNDITDAEAIGPYRLWATAGAVALVFCMASSFIATPKMENLRVRLAAQGISAQQQALLQKEYAKVSNFSLQFLSIRALLAVGMAMGLKKLPRKKKAGGN
jgi:predicted nucleic acid-binding Zn ribbon protein